MRRFLLSKRSIYSFAAFSSTQWTASGNRNVPAEYRQRKNAGRAPFARNIGVNF
jgi:hypothetical protein